MARIEIAARALLDLERLFDFIATVDPVRAREQIASVRRAFELLAEHPLLGGVAEDGRRELVLSRGHYGYIASTAGCRRMRSSWSSQCVTNLKPDTRKSNSRWEPVWLLP